MHTMYLDKVLSWLNPAHPQKQDMFVLDFVNDPDIIQKTFEQYYRKTILADETVPNMLHDLKAYPEAIRCMHRRN